MTPGNVSDGPSRIILPFPGSSCKGLGVHITPASGSLACPQLHEARSSPREAPGSGLLLRPRLPSVPGTGALADPLLAIVAVGARQREH